MGLSEAAESIERDVDDLRRRAIDETTAAETAAALDEVQRRFLGKRGVLRDVKKRLGAVSPDERPRIGSALQEATASIEAAIDGRRATLSGSEQPIVPGFDPTLPGTSSLVGGLHPTIQMMYDLNDAFAALNFDIYSGPEVTSELYEFDGMNFPPDHPARESMDTYWLTESVDKSGSERLCLRPHLTGASVRYMQQHEPPFRFVYPGRVYRNESTDARHERAFFQYEALIVDRNVPFSEGKLLVETILNTVFGYPVRTRMRVGFFPFVEPGFEIDMECLVCGGKGCSVCKQVGWLEVMPGGVPHPNVLKAGGLDPEKWTGFYINVGLDRLVMMRYGIDDVRLFHSTDVRFLSQFK